MPMPSVSTKVVDLTTRVTSEGTYNSAIVVAAKKGPIDLPVLVTSQTDFLERFTPDETLEIGWDTALYEAYIYLAQNSNLYVVRAAKTTGDEPALFGGCHIRTFKSALDNEELDDGFRAVEEHSFMTNGGVPDPKTRHYDTPEDVMDIQNDAFILYGASQGKYNNDLAVSIIIDPDSVKLEGAFIINVYKKGVLVETHTCSLNPGLKNGYGVSCYIETVLNASSYIRADVNDDEDVIKDTSYVAKVTGTYKFENEICKYIEIIKVPTETKTFDSYKITRKQDYLEGDICWVNDTNGGIANAYGYYMCTTAGTTGAAVPNFAQNNKYKATVADGTAVWTLQEIVKPATPNTDYNAGDIIEVENGSTCLYYRALTSGATGTELPTFGEDIAEVEDVEITWENQTQTVKTLETCLDEENQEDYTYTYVKKAAGTVLPLSQVKVYVDKFLSTEVTAPESVTILNPLRKVDWETREVIQVEETIEPTYKVLFTGDAEEEHYALPKASSIDEKGKVIKTPFNGGSDGADVTDVERIRALKTLQNVNDINIQLIMDGGNTTPAYQRAIDDVCNYREQSCKGIISVPFVNEMGMVASSLDGSVAYGNARDAVVGYRKYDLNANTRNLELYTTHQMVYDEFNDRNIYVSPSCFVASRIMSVAKEYGWHWAAAGYNRGVINSLDVANTFDPSEVDTFSDAQINTIIKEPGMGNVIFDELTLLNKACDLQDAHISRYLDIYLRPRVKTALKQYLFEFNDEQTRMLITKMLNTFLDPEVSARALYDYRVICDLTNNKPRDIQNNVCNVWIFLQIVHLAKWIKCDFIVSPYGVDFGDLGYTG